MNYLLINGTHYPVSQIDAPTAVAHNSEGLLVNLPVIKINKQYYAINTLKGEPFQEDSCEANVKFVNRSMY